MGTKEAAVVSASNYVSNSVWIAVSPDGDPCVDENATAFGETVTLSGTVKVANLNMLRAVNRETMHGTTFEIGTEIGTANFFQFEVSDVVTVPALPGPHSTNLLFLNPGTFPVDNCKGGPGGPAFTGSANQPKPVLIFDNIDENTVIDRSKGVTVRWGGVDSKGFVSIIGNFININRVAASAIERDAKEGK